MLKLDNNNWSQYREFKISYFGCTGYIYENAKAGSKFPTASCENKAN